MENKKNSLNVLVKLEQDLKKIFDDASKQNNPHYAIAFHIGDDGGSCGSGNCGCFPESLRAHVSEEIQKQGRDFLTDPPHEVIPVIKISVNKSDIN